MKHTGLVALGSWLCVVLLACGGEGEAPNDTSSSVTAPPRAVAPPETPGDDDAASPTEASDAASPDARVADASQPSCTPASIGGLALWLDAAHVTTAGAAVSSWPDQTSHHNNATQTATNNRPMLVTTMGGAGAPSSINGHPVVTFTRASHDYLSIPDAASLQWSTRGFTIAAVAANRGPVKGLGHLGGTSLLFFKAAAPDSQLNIGFNLNFPVGENVDDGTMAHFGLGEGYPSIKSTTTGYDDGKPRLYVGIADTTGGKQTLEIRVNGASVGKTAPSTTIDDIDLIGQTTYIGALKGGYLGFEGDIAELVAVGGPTSTSDLACLETFMMTKYGL